MADLSSDIATQAIEPASVTADGQTAAARPIADLVTAQQTLDAKVANKKRRRGILFTKLVTPGALSDGGACSPGFNGGC